MQSPSQIVLPCEVISSGPDWITATAKTGASKYDMGVYASNEFDRARDAGVKVTYQKRQGYEGYAVPGFFHGEKHGSAMVCASGDVARDVWRGVSSVCDNVSRLDVQVTVYTILETPHVAKVAYENIKRGELGIIPIRNATYIEGHPNGETININRRSSDTSGRCYDKASESDLGIPRTVWRYEVECHRRSALAAVAALRAADSPTETSRRLVHSWFDRRGVRPLFDVGPDSNAFDLSLSKHKGDTMAWFRDTLAKTVAKQIKLHGRNAVEEALGLTRAESSKLEEVTIGPRT